MSTPETENTLPAARDRYALNPVTGELVDLVDSTTDILAVELDDVRTFEAELRHHKRRVSDEVIARMDVAATWTVRLPGGLRLTAPSPAPSVEYDAQELRRALLEHAAENGGPSRDAIDKAIETVVTFKVRQAGLNALRKLPGLDALIDRHAKPAHKQRYVTIGRS